MRLDRREFLGTAVAGTAAALAHSAAVLAPRAQAAAAPASPTALVPLGKGPKVCYVGAGTGMSGGNRQSNHTRMGREKFEALLHYEYDHGIRLFDMADIYGTHPFVAQALKGKPRDEYQLFSKIWVRPGGIPERERPPADVVVKRFLKELQTDYIDLVQIHCMESADWPKQQRSYMDAMEKLKEQGLIRAHGVSCHTLPALAAAAEEPWVDAIHARINPYKANMDDTPEKVVPVLKKAHANGKGIIGMKLMGEGSFDAQQRKKSLEWVIELGCVDVLVVGFEKTPQIDEFLTNLRQKLARASEKTSRARRRQPMVA